MPGNQLSLPESRLGEEKGVKQLAQTATVNDSHKVDSTESGSSQPEGNRPPETAAMNFETGCPGLPTVQICGRENKRCKSDKSFVIVYAYETARTYPELI